MMVGDGVPVASQFAVSDRPALMVAFPGRTRNIGGTRRGWGGGGVYVNGILVHVYAVIHVQ